MSIASFSFRKSLIPLDFFILRTPPKKCAETIDRQLSIAATYHTSGSVTSKADDTAVLPVASVTTQK